MKVLLTYFKLTGKYYSGGEYETTRQHLWEVWNEVRTMLEEHRLPGLVHNHSEFLVTVDAPEHKHNHPHLVMSKNLWNKVDEYEGSPQQENQS